MVSFLIVNGDVLSLYESELHFISLFQYFLENFKKVLKKVLTNASFSAIIMTVACGCSSMVESQPSKLVAWVRFPSPAPSAKSTASGAGFADGSGTGAVFWDMLSQPRQLLYAPVAQLDRATAF